MTTTLPPPVVPPVTVPPVTVPVPHQSQAPIHHKEGHHSEGGREALPDDGGVPVVGTEGVGDQVDQGVSDQGPHCQADQTLQGRGDKVKKLTLM